ncbi:hypothetical protein ACU8V7_16005 [Zobellia nedashkovskayae]
MDNIMIHPLLIEPLQHINFSARYKKLCGNKKYDPELVRFDSYLIPLHFKERGYELKFNKEEKFYKINNKVNEFDITFNLLIRKGFIQFVWDVLKEKERFDLGYGMWESIVRNMDLINSDKFEGNKKPLFINNDELKDVLMEGFNIHEDFLKQLALIK